MRSLTTNTAPGSAGQNVAHTLAEELNAANRKRLIMEAAAPQMLEVLKVVQTGLEDRAEMYGVESYALRLVRAGIEAATGEGK